MDAKHVRTLERKTAQFNVAMAHIAAELGLKFVDGPDPYAVPSPKPSLGPVNYQERGVYCFAVA
jgi:hypothetical protein